jgi:hypothetical protein
VGKTLASAHACLDASDLTLMANCHLGLRVDVQALVGGQMVVVVSRPTTSANVLRAVQAHQKLVFAP